MIFAAADTAIIIAIIIVPDNGAASYITVSTMVTAVVVVGNGVNISCWFCVFSIVVGSGGGDRNGQVMHECGCHGIERHKKGIVVERKKYEKWWVEGEGRKWRRQTYK